jgi:hypothetical protein
MAYREIGLVLNFTIRAERLEDQQALALFEADPGGAITPLGKEALDVAQATSLARDHASEGWGEAKAAASSHEAQGV